MKPPKLRKTADDAKSMAAYVALFHSMDDAALFQKAVLATADVHLPAVARVVKSGGQPTALYWRWLAVTAEVWS